MSNTERGYLTFTFELNQTTVCKLRSNTVASLDPVVSPMRPHRYRNVPNHTTDLGGVTTLPAHDHSRPPLTLPLNTNAIII